MFKGKIMKKTVPFHDERGEFKKGFYILQRKVPGTTGDEEEFQWDKVYFERGASPEEEIH